MAGVDPELLKKVVASPRYAALVRTDLSISAIGTWDSHLPRDTRLVVPMDVQALVVGPGDTVAIVPTETVVPITVPGTERAEVMPIPPEPFGAPTGRAAGIHLHWAMPDGLTRGDAGKTRDTAHPAGNPLGLPPLPDRWVVARLVHGSQVVRSWVLEADRGDHQDLLGWREPGPLPAPAPGTTRTGASGRRYISRETLTAVAGGDVAWAATYDAVIDRFAFHDDLADLDPTTLDSLRVSYLVAGWWSDPAIDPLHDVTSLGRYKDRTQWLGWLAPVPEGVTDDADQRGSGAARRGALRLKSAAPLGAGYAARAASVDRLTADPVTADPAASVMMASSRFLQDDATLFVHDKPNAPRQTVVHGAVFGVRLKVERDLAPNVDDVEIAVGPTPSAALAAMLADGTNEQRRSSEQVLAAFAGGLLPTIDAAGGLVAIDEYRHGSTFVGTSAGVKATPDRIAQGDIMTPTDTDRPAPTASPIAPSTGSQLGAARLKHRVELVSRDYAAVQAADLSQRYGQVKAPRPPRSFRDVPASQPRYFVPADLTVLVRHAHRSLRHGGDRNHDPGQLLGCRLPSGIARGLEGVVASRHVPPGLRSFGSGSIPPEMDLLLQEAVLFDPYRWQEISIWSAEGQRLPLQAVGNRVRAEMTLRYAFHPTGREIEPVLDHHVRDALRPASVGQGEDMSPVGWTRWAQAWVPLWCDWELDLAVDDRLDGWDLGQIDTAPKDGLTAAGSRSVAVVGRSLLTGSAAPALAAEITKWLEEERQRDVAKVGQVSDRREGELAAAVAAAPGTDVVAASLRGVREVLLGLDPHDATRLRIKTDGTLQDSDGNGDAKPRALGLPLLLAGGKATVKRLRIVDAFGRFLDVPDAVLARAEMADTIDHPDGAPTLTLAPRWQRPARLNFRFVDPRPADGTVEVDARIDQQHPDLAISPVAGWLLPDHVDEALEFFDASGFSLGQLMHDPITGTVMWEGAPGRTGPIGGPPDPGPDPGARHLTRLAVGLISTDATVRNGPDADTQPDSALSALLRAIDTTLWTTDPLGSIGSGAVAGLVGRPIAVVRATLRLDVLDDLDELSYPSQADRDARAAAYRDLRSKAIAVRLGELTRTDDGLLAYAVDDDYSRVQAVAPEIRSLARRSGRMQGQLSVFGRGSQLPPDARAITHPYIAAESSVAVRPEQTVRLTLLMAPGGKVHATSGVLPRKSLALARDWFHDTLTKLSPSFRVGPVLVDPTGIRMPRVTGLGDKQVFTRRDTPLTWKDDAILASSQTALLPEQPHNLQEGWIRVLPVDDTGGPGGSGAGGSGGGA